jgi:predicted RNA methylase
MATEPIAEFFDREACCQVGAGGKAEEGGAKAAGPRPIPGATGVSVTLLKALEDAGIEGRTVLELGSGTGKLSIELLRRGAAAVTGVDLSPRSVELSASRAADAGFADRARFEVGDAAAASVRPHDMVVSDKVYCCYPDPDRLLANTLPAARSVYALALPESRGLTGKAARLVILGENAWRLVRRDAFRAHVHDLPRIEHAIGDAGFVRSSSRRHWGWRVLVYTRA